ncbi:MAG TPA: DUF5018 domain-containing protein [Sphingobacterium sp.]|nr:DUF5018 domain-containing protein [Sphingobacterium sp.]
MKKLLNKIIYSFTALFLLVSCEEPNYLVPNDNNLISDFYATIDGRGSERLFNARVVDNVIYVDIDYYYPIDSDNEVDLTKMLLRASIPTDAKINPGLDSFFDLSTPKRITVTSGTGETQEYTIEANKKGNTDISKIGISFVDPLNGPQEVEGIINGTEIVFFVMPGFDLSDVTLTYQINRHASGSVANGASVNFSSSTLPFKVTAPGNAEKDYTLLIKEPVKLDQGVGISRRLFAKTAADLGFTANNETSCFVSGDYLVIVTRTNPSVFKVYNRFTGQYLHNLTNPFPAGRLIFQGFSDENGRFALGTYTPAGAAFIVYRYNDVFDTAPTKILDVTYTKPAAVAAADGNIGRKLAWAGDLMTGRGVLTASVATSRYYVQWTMNDGVFTGTTPEVIEYKDGATSLGFLPEYLPLSATLGADVIASASAELVYMSGSSFNKIATFPTVTGNILTGSTAFVHFNNADFLANYKFLGANTSARMYVYDITDKSRIGISTTAPNYGELRVYESETFVGGANANATGDICIGTSDGGERLQVYMLTTFGHLVAHEFTVYASEN